MRVRIVQVYSEMKLREILEVQKWQKASWVPMREFELLKYGDACEFAMAASMTKKAVTEVVVFDEGLEVVPNFCAPENPGVDSPPLPQ